MARLEGDSRAVRKTSHRLDGRLLAFAFPSAVRHQCGFFRPRLSLFGHVCVPSLARCTALFLASPSLATLRNRRTRTEKSLPQDRTDDSMLPPSMAMLRRYRVAIKRYATWYTRQGRRVECAAFRRARRDRAPATARQSGTDAAFRKKFLAQTKPLILTRVEPIKPDTARVKTVFLASERYRAAPLLERA